MELDPPQRPKPLLLYHELVRSNSAAWKASTPQTQAPERPPPPSFGVKTDKKGSPPPLQVESKKGWRKKSDVHYYSIGLFPKIRCMLGDMSYSHRYYHSLQNQTTGWNGMLGRQAVLDFHYPKSKLNISDKSPLNVP